MKFETEEQKRLREKKAREERVRKRIKEGLIKKLSVTTVAYNVDDTSDEKPDISGITDWDEYWKHYTEEKFVNQKCASCCCILDSSTRVGAHIRLKGEQDGTKDAWIALFCDSCNKSKDPQRVNEGSWIVRTKMAEAHENVPTIKDQLMKERVKD